MNSNADFGDSMSAGLVANSAQNADIAAPAFTYRLDCFDKKGNLKWSENIHNLVTTAGKTDIIDKYFKGSAYTAAWYLGLKGAGTAAVGDTMSSHAGWSEVNPYTGNRPTLAFGTTAGGSNTATAVSFAITSSATVAGAFIASANTGTTGTLYSAGDFTASRSVVAGDTLNVTPTVSAS